MLILNISPCFEHVFSDFVLVWDGFGAGRSAGEGYEGDFRADSDAGGEDGLAKAGVYVERLAVLGIEASGLPEHEAAGAPSQDGELHRVGMAGKGERVVLA